MTGKNVFFEVGMTSDDAEKLLEHLKPLRSSWAVRIKKNLKDRIDSASWAINGKIGDIGASIP